MFSENKMNIIWFIWYVLPGHPQVLQNPAPVEVITELQPPAVAQIWTVLDQLLPHPTKKLHLHLRTLVQME